MLDKTGSFHVSLPVQIVRHIGLS